MPKPSRVEFNVTPEERDALDALVQASGLSRQDFIRQRVFNPPGITKGPDTYMRAVEAASKAYAGVPRVHVEAMVAAALSALAK